LYLLDCNHMDIERLDHRDASQVVEHPQFLTVSVFPFFVARRPLDSSNLSEKDTHS
jgi:hypothetical protein